MNSLNIFFENDLVQKAPALPEMIKKFLVSIAPWAIFLSILSCILSALILAGIYLGYIFPPEETSLSQAPQATIFIDLIFYVLALPGLSKKSISGWNWIYYAVLVKTLANLISFNLISGIIGLAISAISMYVLFQIKSYYH